METNVTKFLGDRDIEFEVKPHTAPVFTCEDAARERGVRLAQIVKCMIGVDGEGKYYVMLIPGDKTLKIKRVRQLAGGKRIELAPADKLAEDLDLTVGAISPTQLIGVADKIYMDNSLFREERVDISSGDPSAGVELAASDLERVLCAERGDIISTNG